MAPQPVEDLGPERNGPAGVVERGGRVLGMDILNETPGSTFAQSANLAKSMGAEYLILDMTWKQVEVVGNTNNCSVGTYIDPGNQLALFNAVLPTLPLKMTLNFGLSTTNIWALPSAMGSSIFLLDPTLSSTQASIDIVACRFVNALNFVLNKIQNVNVVSLQKGNEVDYLAEAQNPNFWANYWRFYAAAASFARTIRTSAIVSPVSVGVTGSLAGLTGGKGEIIRAGLDSLNQTISDFVGCNYYPFEGGGSQAKVDLISNKVSSVIAAAKFKPIHFQEFGCQSGTVSGSSSGLQKKCFEELFKVWDANPTKLTHVNLLRLNDLSHVDAQSLASKYIASPPPDFIDYLETLGLKSYDGAEKASLIYIKEQLKSRGW